MAFQPACSLFIHWRVIQATLFFLSCSLFVHCTAYFMFTHTHNITLYSHTEWPIHSIAFTLFMFIIHKWWWNLIERSRHFNVRIAFVRTDCSNATAESQNQSTFQAGLTMKIRTLAELSIQFFTPKDLIDIFINRKIPKFSWYIYIECLNWFFSLPFYNFSVSITCTIVVFDFFFQQIHSSQMKLNNFYVIFHTMAMFGSCSMSRHEIIDITYDVDTLFASSERHESDTASTDDSPCFLETKKYTPTTAKKILLIPYPGVWIEYLQRWCEVRSCTATHRYPTCIHAIYS